MIQRQLHIYCDKCGAEGPFIVGERRPALLQDVVRIGWQLRDDNTHVCAECMALALQPFDEVNAKNMKVTFRPDGGTAVDHDRSVHWTESMKRSE